MIYVTVGTMFMDFPRLINAMDEVAGQINERVVIQKGISTIETKYAESFAFKPRGQVLALQRAARLIICHAGIGSVIDALYVHRPFVVVPRRKKFGEHMNDHQLDLAHAVQNRRWGRMALDTAIMRVHCDFPPPPPSAYRPAQAPLISAIRNDVAAFGV